jgi:hypothetical protein
MNQLPPKTKGDLEVLKIFVVLLVLTLALVYGVQRLLQQPKVPQVVAPAAAGAIQGPSSNSP